ncbi:thiolase family protein [Leifsonia kafniensis]|uniref:thiolase family protein n=1 Tax=Leifsonia kafniensis TaxID=475957 RepID=UPI0031F19070
MSEPFSRDKFSRESGPGRALDPHREPVVVFGRRTAFGRKNGMHRQVSAAELLAPVLAAVAAEALAGDRRSGRADHGVSPNSARIDDVIIGNAVGGGGNVARLAALEAGLGETIPGLTVDRQCGSGLQAIMLACRLVASGAGTRYLAGGVESCSTAPLRAHRLTSEPAHPDFFDRPAFSPTMIGDPDMGVAAENVAHRYGIDRARQDAFALRSHRLATAAIDAGDFTEELVTVATMSERDEGSRRLTPELLGRFPAAFRAGGTVTAGNSCADADGAVVVLVTSLADAAASGHTHYLRFVDDIAVGVDPNYLGIGGGEAAKALLERHALRGNDLGRVEFNEAFAAQVLASLDLIGVSENAANRQGGALALGHPFGASGAMLVLRLLQQHRAQQHRPGIPAHGLNLAAISIAGGIGLASLWSAE